MNKSDLRINRRAKTKKIIRGTAEKPRLVVFRSNKYFYAQAIDDVVGKTLASANKITDAVAAGEKVAEGLLKLKVKKIVFDRAGYKYHGNIKKLAEAVRAKGLEF